MHDRSFNLKVIGPVAATLIIIVFVAYVLADVIRAGNHETSQNSIGTIVDDAP